MRITIDGPTLCDVCDGHGYVIVSDWIDDGNRRHPFTRPDYCPGKCCSPEESEERYRVMHQEVA